MAILLTDTTEATGTFLDTPRGLCESRVEFSMGIPGFPDRFGRYVLIEPLGRGGMGHVVLAMHGKPELETLCVIKRMLPHVRERPDYVARFRQEANLARRLKHPTLVQTQEIGEDDGTLYLVQEFVEGKDLSQLVASCASGDFILPVQLSLYILSEVARGLAYAHDFEGLGLVHRDINPPNIRVGYGGQIKILDFGVAISADAKRSDPGDGWLGKLAYLAPEQQVRGPLDRRTDLYSCGIVLWELLACRPFGTTMKNGEVVFPKGLRESSLEVTPPSVFNPKVSRELDAIAIKSVAREPRDRFQTASEFRKAIEPLLPSQTDAENELIKLLSLLFSVDQERARLRERIEGARPLLDDRRHAADAAPVQVEAGPPTESTLRRAGRSRRRRGAVGIAVGVVAAIALALVFAFLRRDRPVPTVQAVAPREAPTAPHLVPDVPWPEPGTSQSIKPVPVLPAAPPLAQARKEPTRSASHQQDVRPTSPAMRTESTPPTPAETTIDELLARSRSALSQKRYQDAIRDAEVAVGRGGGTPAHIVLGNALLMARKLPDAEREYAAVLRLDPGNDVAAERLNLIRSMRAQGEH
jgi:serine/threonine protein kinase